MATTVSRAAAAAAPPRTFFARGPLSWSRRSAPSVPGNSDSDNWIRDKAARSSLAPPPPPPIQRRDRVEVVGRGSLSDNWVADKRFSVGATPAPAARGGVYVPPPLKKLLLPLDTSASPASAARADPSPPKPVDTSASPAAAAAHADPSPLKPVDTSPFPADAARSDPSLPAPLDGLPCPAAHVPVIRPDLQVEEPIPVATLVVGAYLEVEEPLALCADPLVNKPLVATTAATFTGADLQVDEPVPVVSTPAPDLGPSLEVEEPLALCADLRLNEPLLATIAAPVVDADLQVEEPVPVPVLGAYLEVEVEEPEPIALHADPLVNEPVVATTAAPDVSADLQVEMPLASSTISAMPAPAVCAPLTKIERWDSMKIDGRASLSKSWVADKLPVARATTASSSGGAWSGDCSKRNDALSSAHDDYYAGGAFVKSPDPGSLPAPPTVMNKLFRVGTLASPAAAARANLSLPLLLDTLPSPASPIPIVLTDLLVEEFVPVATTRQDGNNVTGHALLSKSLVVDKLLTAGATTFSSRGAWSGGCGTWSCAPSSTIDYYAGPAFLKSPDPARQGQFKRKRKSNKWRRIFVCVPPTGEVDKKEKKMNA